MLASTRFEVQNVPNRLNTKTQLQEFLVHNGWQCVVSVVAFNGLQQSFVAFFIVGVHLLVTSTFNSLLSRSEDPSELLLRVMISGFFWPILVVIYDRLSMAFRI